MKRRTYKWGKADKWYTYLDNIVTVQVIRQLLLHLVKLLQKAFAVIFHEKFLEYLIWHAIGHELYVDKHIKQTLQLHWTRFGVLLNQTLHTVGEKRSGPVLYQFTRNDKFIGGIAAFELNRWAWCI